MCTVEATVGESVTFPTTAQLFEQDKVQNHDTSMYITRWERYSNWDCMEVNEVYFDNYNGGDISLYACWDVEPISITYILDGGTNHPNNPSVVTHLHDILNPTRDGYKFVGWTYTDNNYNNPSDKPTNELYRFELGEGATLTAHWEENRIIFVGNSETSGTMSSISYNIGETINLPNNQFAKNGCTFLGWSEDRYNTYSTIYNSEYTSNEGGEITLYAMWETGLNMTPVKEYNEETFEYEVVGYSVSNAKEGYPNAFVVEEYNGVPITSVMFDSDNIVKKVTFESLETRTNMSLVV